MESVCESAREVPLYLVLYPYIGLKVDVRSAELLNILCEQKDSPTNHRVCVV